ncbi:MAG: membrane protein insertion efficiency factor YidD [Akkermansiaceae bacterium]
MISRFLTFLIRSLIRFYQRILNPMIKATGGPGLGCRYDPTCSHYFLQAAELHGPFRGSWYGICRIFRCHPWGGSGYDPVPSARNATAEKNSCSCPHDTSHH